MVEFILLSQSDNYIRYEYYPENDKTKTPGIIVVDKRLETIEVSQPAELDNVIIHTASEKNELRDAINEMRRECGVAELTEEELPTETEDEEVYWYAQHAINKIRDALVDGIVLEKGSSIWY